MSARPVEVITTTERRRSYTDAERAAVLAECAEPGAVIAAIARRHGIAESLIYGWRSRQRLEANLAAEPLQFIPYGTVAEAAPDAPTADPPAALPAPMPLPALAAHAPVPAAEPQRPAPLPAAVPPPAARRPAAPPLGALRPAPGPQPGAIIVDLPTGVRLTVDAFVNERALLRVLRALSGTA